MTNIVVKLDVNGDVCGVSPGPEREGWVTPDASAALDPFNHRLCPDRGWVCKTEAEQAAFEKRHAPPAPPEHPAKRELRELRLKRSLAGIDQDRAIKMLIDIVLGDK